MKEFMEPSVEIIVLDAANIVCTSEDCGSHGSIIDDEDPINK